MKKSLWVVMMAGLFAIAMSAQDASSGGNLYKQQCASCHGDKLEGRSGPPLAMGDFRTQWPNAQLVSKIKNTMPLDNPGKLSAAEAAGLAAYIEQANPATTSTAAPARAKSDFPPVANLQQLMRGIMFPNSNIIFTVQTHNPAEKKKSGVADSGFNWAQWGTDLYSGWDIVDYASLALAESAPLMLTPGRTCQNGKPVPVDDPDWIRFTKEMAEVGRRTYAASQTRNQEKVSDMSGDVADACLHCHQMFRDRFPRGRGRGAGGPGAGGPGGGGGELRCTKAQKIPEATVPDLFAGIVQSLSMPLAPGRRLGPYEILAPLGAGGMGEVYRARDTRLNRDVAIKILPEHAFGDPDAVVRFEREATGVAALAHPNILVLHDVGAEQEFTTLSPN
jgi:cytochrome c553